MGTMQAVRLTRWHSAPELVEVDIPTPGPGQLLVRIAGAGLCHSDLHLMHAMDDGVFPWGPPFTLGHENAGWVHALGEGVQGLTVGDPVALMGCWGCGRCPACLRGEDNYCHDPLSSYGSAFGGGLGVDGGIAEYMLVPDPRFCVPIPEGLDPVAAAPLTDAALTPYHAVSLSLAKMLPTSTVVIIGVGGLGHMGVQIVKAMSAARVVALDIRDEALALATECGADAVLRSDSDDTVARIKDMTGGRGADVVIDFVATDETHALAVGCARQQGDFTIVGGAGGTFAMGLYSAPYELCVRSTFWGNRTDLGEVLALAARGLINAEYTTVPITEAVNTYSRLEAGAVRGRAVVVPS
jgi:propanol-preferring alcohol dehydrogenase